MSNPIFRTPLQGAVYLFNLGFKVFPLAPNSKIPPKGLKWKEWAQLADIKRITDYGTANPTYNWGVSCGPSELVVVDVDIKNNKDGYSSLAALNALPPTFTVSTPSGGKHFYFKGIGKTSVEILGEGLDTRGTGGYVVSPGSLIDEQTYKITNSMPLEALPTWVSEKLQEKKPELKRPQDNETEGSITHGSRDNDLTRWAGHLRNIGLTYEEIYSALSAINENRCNPPLDDTDVKRITRSISKHERGDALAVADFSKPEAHNHQIIKASNIKPKDQPKRDWVMYGRYIGSFISLLVAPGGAGKSMLAMLDALSIAAKRELTNSRIVKSGAVWIHNAEDPLEELEGRVLALCQHYKIPNTSLFNMLLTSGRSTKLILAETHKSKVSVNTEAVQWMKDFIKNNKIRLAIFDPLINMHHVDENSNKEMAIVMDLFSDIAEETKCAIGIVHHSNKAAMSKTFEPGNAAASRGASVVTNSARIAQTLSTMSEKDGRSFGLTESERRWYVRVDDAKANLQPPAEKASWFKKVSVEIWNGDSYGTLEYEELKNEMTEKAIKANERDIMFATDKVMKDEAHLSVFQVAKRIVSDTSLTHLFGGVKHKSLERRIIKGLEETQNFKLNSYSLRTIKLGGKERKAVFKELIDTSFLE